MRVELECKSISRSSSWSASFRGPRHVPTDSKSSIGASYRRLLQRPAHRCPMRSELLALALAQVLTLPLPKETGRASQSTASDASPAQRKPVQRTITVTDDNLSTVPEIHVAPDCPTTLVFATPLAKDNQAVMLAQPGREFAPPKFTDT